VSGPSILWRTPPTVGERPLPPSCLADLQLDAIVAAITGGRDEYGVRDVFYLPLPDADAVAYRHEVFRDLADDARRERVLAFARALRQVRRLQAQGAVATEPRQRERLALDATLVYVEAVALVDEAFRRHPPASRGLAAVARYLAGYAASEAFASLRAEASRIRRALDAVRYDLTVLRDRVIVRRAEGDADELVDTDDADTLRRAFARFGSGPPRRPASGASEEPAATGLDAQILQHVARLHPEPFAALTRFVRQHGDPTDPTVAAFDREVQFYLAVLEYVERWRRSGVPFTYPHLTDGDRSERVEGAVDLALVERLVSRGEAVVANRYHLEGRERFLVVTGANQGGKTTFARTFGQLHVLAALGCPVAAEEARLVLADRVLTHFEREEDLGTLRSKLQDELVRARELLEVATPRSVVIVNEAFNAATAGDAEEVARRVLGRLIALGAVGVWVTFVDELAAMDPGVVSLVCGVDPDDPTRRTFELARRPADGRAYALAIARAHGLTFDQLRRRRDT
jgi:DNA mismatch repair protein MutS